MEKVANNQENPDLFSSGQNEDASIQNIGTSLAYQATQDDSSSQKSLNSSWSQNTFSGKYFHKLRDRYSGSSIIRSLMSAFLGAGIILPVGLALGYILNVVLARSLTVDEFGLWGYAQSLGSMLALIAGLGFSSSMMRLVAAYREQKQFGLLRGLVSSSLVLIGVTGSLIVAVSFGLKSFFPNVFGDGLIWGAVLVLPTAIDAWRESTTRGLLRTIEAILPRHVLLPGLTLVLAFVFPFNSIFRTMLIYVGLFVFIEMIVLLRLRNLMMPLFSDAPQVTIKKWLGISAPIGITSLAMLGMKSWDILVVGSFLGLQAAGPYVAAARTALLASLVIRIINLTIGPLLAQFYHGGQLDRFRKLIITGTIVSTILGTPLFLGILIFSEQIMRIFGSNYAGGALLLRILATGEFINLITGPVGLALNMSTYERESMLILVATSFISVVAMILSSQVFGILGVAYVSSGSTIFLNLAFVFLSYWFFFRTRKMS